MRIDINKYLNDGFFLGPRILLENQVIKARDAVNSLWQIGRTKNSNFEIDGNINETNILRRAFNIHRIDPIIQSIIHNRQMVEVAKALMQCDDVALWYMQVIDKPPIQHGEIQNNGNIGWHQDFKYWQCCSNRNLLTAWVALQTTNSENGALQFVRDSHTWGLLEYNKGFNNKNLQSGAESIQDIENKNWEAVTVKMSAGQVCFHHCLTLHASGPNLSSEHRLGIAIHLMPAITEYQNHSECHRSLTFLGKMPQINQKFTSIPKNWPIL